MTPRIRKWHNLERRTPSAEEDIYPSWRHRALQNWSMIVIMTLSQKSVMFPNHDAPSRCRPVPGTVPQNWEWLLLLLQAFTSQTQRKYSSIDWVIVKYQVYSLYRWHFSWLQNNSQWPFAYHGRLKVSSQGVTIFHKIDTNVQIGVKRSWKRLPNTRN